MFDRAQATIDDDEVTDHEWFVDHDRQRREQIAQNVLHGQGHGDTADAQSGHHRRDIDAKIVEPQQQQHRPQRWRSEEHTSELQSLMRISYAVFCLKKKTKKKKNTTTYITHN